VEKNEEKSQITNLKLQISNKFQISNFQTSNRKADFERSICNLRIYNFVICLPAEALAKAGLRPACRQAGLSFLI